MNNLISLNMTFNNNLKMNEKKKFRCKVVLVGETCAKKTTIIERFVENTLNETNRTTNLGTSYIFKTMNIEGNKFVQFRLWDTAGQKRFRGLAKISYKTADACLLVYDITNKSSFEEIKYYWVNEIKENAPKNISKKYIIIIIGSFSIGWK